MALTIGGLVLSAGDDAACGGLVVGMTGNFPGTGGGGGGVTGVVSTGGSGGEVGGGDAMLEICGVPDSAGFSVSWLDMLSCTGGCAVAGAGSVVVLCWFRTARIPMAVTSNVTATPILTLARRLACAGSSMTGGEAIYGSPWVVFLHINMHVHTCNSSVKHIDLLGGLD